MKTEELTLEPPSVLERLFRLAPRGAELGLARMRAACERFGHPERQFEAVHVAGTNGKGSVCAMLSAMGSASGRLVGTYTSPHLCRYAERIQIDGAAVEQSLLECVLEQVLTEAPELTFFEVTTLTAFVLFASLEVETAVIEVGLGGRLDATNVLPKPKATAITRIALDHTEQLGATLGSIAREKAGIIKPDVPVVLGPLDSESRAEILQVARTMQAPATFATEEPWVRSFVDAHPPALHGKHQFENAAVAVALGAALDLPESALSQGLAQVSWPGRLEEIATPDGPVLLDSAHNPDGAAVLADWLRSRGCAPSDVALVFGVMADKDYPGMLFVLAPLAGHRVFLAPEGRRAADPKSLCQLVPGVVAKTTADALKTARTLVGPGKLVVVAGSIFLVGAARALLLGLERDPVIAL